MSRLVKYHLENAVSGESVGTATDLYSAAIGCVFGDVATVWCRRIDGGELIFQYHYGDGFIFSGVSDEIDEALTYAMSQIVRLEKENDELKKQLKNYNR